MKATLKDGLFRLVLATLLAPIAVILASGSLAAETPANAPPQVTFSKEVAPILQQHCQECHRPNAIAPMSLLTYEEVRPWAKAIKERVSARMMPPWFIDPNVGINEFKNYGGPSEEVLAAYVKWGRAWAPQWNPRSMTVPAKIENLIMY